MRKQWAAGIDIGGTKIQFLQVDREGRIGERVRHPTNVDGGHEAVLKEILEGIQELTEKVGTPPIGVGIGIAGQVEEERGIVTFAPNLKWRDVPVKERLEKALSLPVMVMNDVRAATWGEWKHGAGSYYPSLLCIFVGTGVGGGIVIDNTLVKGNSNSAGEIGHMTLSLNGPLCSCGNRGCLEAFSGGWAIAKRGQEEALEGSFLLEKTKGDRHLITGSLVLEGARERDPLSLMIVQEAVDALTAASISLVNILNPARILFGGGVIEGMPEAVSLIEKGVRERALKAATKTLSFSLAALGNDAGAVGAASLIIANT